MTKIRNLIAAAMLGVVALPSLAQTTTASPESRAYTNELMGDAAGRASTAGGDNKDFTVKVGGTIQFRYTANFGENNKDDYEGGFSNPLTHLNFSGNLHTFDYKVQGAFNNTNGNAFLKDAYLAHTFEGNRVQFGQFKLPFMREVSMSDELQLAADRSLVASTFGQGRSQGAQISVTGDRFRVLGAVSDGFNTANTDFTDPREADYGLTGRAEWVVVGKNFDQFKDFTSEKADEAALLAGGGFHYQDGDMGRFWSGTADLGFEAGGFSAFGAGVARDIEDNAGNKFLDIGAVGQASYRLTEKFELFGRYDMIIPDDDRALLDDYTFLTAGINYYMVGHAAKFTVDAVYSFNDTNGLGSLTGFSNTGLLGSTDSGELAFRAQVQLMF